MKNIKIGQNIKKHLDKIPNKDAGNHTDKYQNGEHLKN